MGPGLAPTASPQTYRHTWPRTCPVRLELVRGMAPPQGCMPLVQTALHSQNCLLQHQGPWHAAPCCRRPRLWALCCQTCQRLGQAPSCPIPGHLADGLSKQPAGHSLGPGRAPLGRRPTSGRRRRARRAQRLPGGSGKPLPPSSLPPWAGHPSAQRHPPRGNLLRARPTGGCAISTSATRGPCPSACASLAGCTTPLAMATAPADPLVPMSPHLHPPRPSLQALPSFLLGPLAIRCNGTPYRMIRRSCQPGNHGCTDVGMPWPGGAGPSGSPSQTLLTDYAHLRLPMPMPRPLAAWPATPELICPPKASAPPLRSPAHGPATRRMLPEHMFLPPCRNTLGQAPGCNPETIACHAGVPETMPRHALAHVGPATLGGGQAGRPGN